MRMNAFQTLRSAANWVLRILDARVPMDVVYGLQDDRYGTSRI